MNEEDRTDKGEWREKKKGRGMRTEQRKVKSNEKKKNKQLGMKRKKRDEEKAKRNVQKRTDDVHEVVLAGGELFGAGLVADLGGTRAPGYLLL